MSRKYLLLRVAGYVLLLLIVYFGVDPDTLWSNLNQIGIEATVALLIVATVSRFLMALKWRYLCSALGMTASFSQYLKIYYAASFLGYCLPTGLGAEAYRVARLSLSEKSHDVFASMFMEKVIGIFSTVLYAWAGLIYIAYSLDNRNSPILFFILAGFSGIAVIATWASLHSGLQAKLVAKLSRFRVGGYVEKLTDAYSSYRHKKRMLFGNLLLALFETGLRVSILCGIGMTLNLDIALQLLASIITITELIRRLAVVLDGWGLATALQIFMYSLVGITIEQALLIALLSHAVIFTASFPGGLVLLTDRWRKSAV